MGASVTLGTLVIGKNAMLFSVKDSHLMQVSCNRRLPINIKICLNKIVSIKLLSINIARVVVLGTLTHHNDKKIRTFRVDIEDTN